MELRVLGIVEVEIDGRIVDLGNGKERAIIAALGMAAGRPVTAELLTEQVWDGAVPTRSTLHANISRLRRKLARHTAERLIVEHSGAYLLAIDPGAVDWLRFQRLHSRSRALFDAGDADGALPLLDEALGLWRGEALTGLTGGWAEARRISMRNARAAAMALWAEISLRDPADDLTTVLSEFVAEHPTDERLAGHLMRALHAAGHTSDALATFHQFKDRIGRAQGLSPGRGLRRLYENLLAADGATPARGTVPALRPQTDNLHPDIADFTDRRTEVGLLTAPEAHRGVRVLHGLPGVGKTALALHTAHRLRSAFDTRLYLDLRGHHQSRLPPAEALQELLAMLGVPAHALPHSLEQRAALWRDRIAERRTLLVLDDATTAEQVRPLLPGAPESLVLLTSRRRLSSLDGARHLLLEPPARSEAAQLFTAVSGRDHSTESGAVATLVKLCDRLPLALRLTATWLRNHPAWSLSDLCRRLTGTGSLLRGFPESVGQSLAAVLALALDDLSPQARGTVLHLATLPEGEITLQAASALTALEPAACETALEELMDYHLLQETSPHRYRLVGLMGVFAREHAGELAPAHRRAAHHRLLEYYLSACTAADRALSPDRARMHPRLLHRFEPPAFDGSTEAARWLNAERSTLLATITWAYREEGLDEYAARLTHAAAEFLHTYGPWESTLPLHHSAVEVWHSREDRDALAHACIDHGRHLLQLHRSEGALNAVRQARDHWLALGDAHGQAIAAHHLGLVHARAGRYSRARPHLLEALRLYRSCGRTEGLASCLNHCGICDDELGDLDGATDRFTEALGLADGAGDLLLIANVRLNLARVYRTTGRHRESLRLLTEALHLFRRLDDRRKEASALNNLGEIHSYKGLHQQALAYRLQALKMQREMGDHENEIKALIGAGNAHLGLDSPATALEHFRRAKDLVTRHGGPDVHTTALGGLATAHAELGDDERAESLFAEALTIAEEAELPVERLDILLKQVRHFLVRKQTRDARASLERARSLGSRMQDPQRAAEVEVLAEALARHESDEAG